MNGRMNNIYLLYYKMSKIGRWSGWRKKEKHVFAAKYSCYIKKTFRKLAEPNITHYRLCECNLHGYVKV